MGGNKTAAARKYHKNNDSEDERPSKLRKLDCSKDESNSNKRRTSNRVIATAKPTSKTRSSIPSDRNAKKNAENSSSKILTISDSDNESDSDTPIEKPKQRKTITAKSKKETNGESSAKKNTEPTSKKFKKAKSEEERYEVH